MAHPIRCSVSFSEGMPRYSTDESTHSGSPLQCITSGTCRQSACLNYRSDIADILLYSERIRGSFCDEESARRLTLQSSIAVFDADLSSIPLDDGASAVGRERAETGVWTRGTIVGIGGGVGPAAGVSLHSKIIENTITDGTDQTHFEVCHGVHGFIAASSPWPWWSVASPERPRRWSRAGAFIN